MATEIVIGGPGDWDRFRDRLAHPERLLKRFGAMLVSDAKASFDRQGLGNITWPARYPSQKGPFLNVAGAVADFAAGRKAPLPRRFQSRPAGLDTGDTRRRIAFEVLPPDGVRVGSTSEQAGRMQKGGESTQPISDSTKARIKAYIEKDTKRGVFVPDYVPLDEARRGLGLKKGAKRNKKGELVVSEPNPHKKKLFGLTLPGVTSLTTRVHARPFLGVTDQMRGDLLRATEEFLATGSA